MERLSRLTRICASLANMDGAASTAGHRLVSAQQSDLGAQWRWINAELNLAEAGKGNEEMVCRGGGGEGETRRKLEEALRIREQSTCESVRR